MEFALETSRLWLREMVRDDVVPLLAVLGDAETMRHYPAAFTRHQVGKWIEWNLENYKQHGYGLWALISKETGELIGDCGLTWQRVGYSPERALEAGWHVRRDQWNRGLATEAALAVRGYAKEVLHQPRLISIIDPHNLASQAVARKLGMALEREDVLDNRTRLIYALSGG